MNNMTEDYIFLSVVLFCVFAGICLTIMTKFAQKMNHEDLDEQIASFNSSGGSYVETKRFGTDASVSCSTKQITLLYGKRPYLISEVIQAKPLAKTSDRSMSISFSLELEVVDGTKKKIKMSSLEDLVDTMHLLSMLAGGNIRKQSKDTITCSFVEE
ncbi:hypothetical protein [Vibrio vulnificus]|uniref:hypothetical protein n=1 Tax=Vibrio vulnificus TaxID=672 RepID=UPI00324279A3